LGHHRNNDEGALMTTETHRRSEGIHANRSGQHSAPRTASSIVLWMILILSAAGNAASNIIGYNTLVGIGFGLVTVGCSAALIIRHHQQRRNSPADR
jgi:hypothetical protein